MPRIVLVADDSPTIQKRAVGILKGDGYEVETVSNGVAAIKRLSALRPSVVLADVCMPGRDGYEVCEYVKKTAEFSHIPVVLLISDMEPYDSAKGAAVKADGIIKKPFEGRELITLVGKLADEFEAAAVSFDEVSIAPSAALESHVEEFSVEAEKDETPTLVPSPEPDFSAHSSGVAFADPAGEEQPAFSHESQPDAGGFSFAPLEASPSRENDFEFPTLQAETPALHVLPQPGAGFDAPAHSTHDAEATPAFLESMAAPAKQPVFIEDAAAPAVENHSSPMGTAIFHTPHSIPDPVWKEEPQKAVLRAESAGAIALEPHFIAEDLDVSALGDHDHAHPHPHGDAGEPMHDHIHDVNATNLGNFSLDDAAAGQVRLNAEIPEVVYADESAEASALAAPAMEVSEDAEPSPLPEVVYAEPSAEEAALEAPAPQAAVIESELTPAVTEAPEPADQATPIESAPEVVNYHVEAPAQPVTEESHSEEAALEPWAEPGEVEVIAASEEQKPQAAVEGSAHAEFPLEPVAAEMSPFEAAAKSFRDMIAKAEPAAEPVLEVNPAPEEPVHAELAPEPVVPEMSALEGTAISFHELIAKEEPATEPVLEIKAAPDLPAAEEPSEPRATEEYSEPHVTEEIKSPVTPEPVAAAPTVAPTPTADPELVHSIVQKVVAHMAPSFLGEEARADIAKRLAEQIAAELKSKQSS